MKDEAEEQTHLKSEEEVRIAEELRLDYEAKEQSSMKAEEEARLSGEFRMKSEKEEQARCALLRN